MPIEITREKPKKKKNVFKLADGLYISNAKLSPFGELPREDVFVEYDYDNN